MFGMTEEQFWFGEKWLFNVYEKAHYTKLYEEAWLNGLYQDIALQTELGNAFAKKGAKPLVYPKEPFNPFTKTENRLTEEERVQRADEIMQNMSEWLKKRNERR